MCQKNANGGQSVVFRLSDRKYGLDINVVSSIEEIGTITRIPGVKRHVRGIMNVRGEIVPVVDLGVCLGTGGIIQAEEARVIICDLGQAVGILVDEVVEVENSENAERVATEVLDLSQILKI